MRNFNSLAQCNFAADNGWDEMQFICTSSAGEQTDKNI